MASTTLITFLYQAPRYVARVELFGSWDNFTKPYPMSRDKSKSRTNWKGCHSFTDIVCDGDIASLNGPCRDGGLLMGGTYWYYYRLDDDVECHDPAIDSTRGCPFLPGQQVNLLQVPVQADLLLSSCPPELPEVFTLDPSTKYASHHHSMTTSKASTPSDSSARKIPSRASSFKQIFSGAVPRFSLARSRSLPNRHSRTARHGFGTTFEPFRPFSMNDMVEFRDCRSRLQSSIANTVTTQSPLLYRKSSELVDAEYGGSLSKKHEGVFGIADLDLEEQREDDFRESMSRPESSSRSCRTSGVFSSLSNSAAESPCLATRFPCIQPQPSTPSLPDFEPFLLGPLELEISSLDSSFDTTGKDLEKQSRPYLQPGNDNSSTLTLRPLGSPLKDLDQSYQLSPFAQREVIESWRNDEALSGNSEAQPSALQELINDLGYLGSFIA